MSGLKKYVKHIKWLKRGFAVLILVFLLLALRQFDAQSLLESVAQIPLWAVMSLVALQFLTQFLLNVQWHQIAKCGGAKISFLEILKINCRAEVVHVAPAGHVGSDVVRAVQLREKSGCTGEQAAAVVAVQKLFSLSALLSLSLFAVSFLIGKFPFLQATHIRFIFFGVIALFLVFAAIAFFAPHRFRNCAKKSWTIFRRIFATRQGTTNAACPKTRKRGVTQNCGKKTRKIVQVFFAQFLSQIEFIRKSKPKMLLFFLLAFTIWLIYPLKMYLLASQIMPGVSIFYVGAAAFVAYMVAMLPLFPAGLGGFEGTMTGLLLLIGFTQSGALVVTVLFRFITFWLVLLASLALVGLWKIKR